MLLCQPNDFYYEMKLISDNRHDFLKLLDLPTYQLPNNIDNVDPVSYLIKMCVSQVTNHTSNNIFALRTFGTHNSLYPKETDLIMQVYYATISYGSLFISKPSVSDIIFKENEMYFVYSDEYGDEEWFSLNDIAMNEYDNPNDVRSYIHYHEDIFEPRNLLAKIPETLLQNLV